jgi:hypothetical protein
MVFVSIKRSTNNNKKYIAIFYSNDKKKIKTTHFGQKSASDFTKNKDPERKRLYLERHKKRENWNDYMTAGALSRWILWNKPTFEESYRSYKSKFNLTKY